MQIIWPDANLPDPGSGHTEDFISWAHMFGCGNYYQPPKPEYPLWQVFYYTDSLYNYDENIRAVWNHRIDLQQIYTDAHHRSYGTSPINMISWAQVNGYNEDPFLINYNYWPYIGGSASYNVKETVNSKVNLSKRFSLSQNYPNPFNPTTKIKFELPEDMKVTLKVYDILGKELKTLVDLDLKQGSHEVEWDAANYASGIYYYKLIAGDYTEVRKMVLIK